MACNCNKITNIIVSGLGGQGVLKVTDIIADVLFRNGYDIKKSEVHGMSQRGGSVSSEVRFGCKVASPMVPYGECDILAVLQQDQVEVVLGKLKSGGVLITPDDIPVDKLFNPKALNIMMLGAISRYMDIPEDHWGEAIKNALPEKVHAGNLEMFALGRGEL